MSKPTRALRRLAVAGLATATIGSGLTAFAAAPALAATADVTNVTLTPTNTAVSTGAEIANNTGTGQNAGCQLYTISATDADGNDQSATINVILTPSAGVDSKFCYDGTGGSETIVSGGGTDVGNPGQPDQAEFTGTNIVIGVNENVGTSANAPQGTPGTIGITAYADQNNNNQKNTGEASGTATESIISSPTQSNDAGQDEITDTLQVDHNSSTGTAGNGTEDYIITTLHGSSLVAGADVYYQVESSQGDIIDSNYCGFTANGDANLGQDDGTVECDVPNPSTLTSGPGSPQSGPYTVTFYTPHPSCDAGSTTFVAGCDASTTATLNEVEEAPANSSVYLSCGDDSTQHWAPDYCEDSGSARSETLTALVLKPASNTATTATVPAAGVQVEFFYDYGATNGGDASTFDPKTCVTGADGTCSTTLKRAANNTGNNAYDAVYAKIITTGGAVYSTDSTGNDSDTYVDWGYYNFESPATNIDGQPDDQSAAVGTVQTISFAVTNQYGNPANETCFTDDYDLSQADGDTCSGESLASPNAVSHTTIPVTVSISGAGTFADGTTTKVVNVTDGTAQVGVKSGSPGTSTITGSLNAGSTDCTVDAPNNSNGYENDYTNYDPIAEAVAGNCTDQVTVEWTSTQPTGKTHEKLKLACFSRHPHKIKCVAQTNPAKAGLTVVFYNKRGHKVGIDTTNAAGKAVLKLGHKKSGKTYTYQAHLRHSATTFSADSRRASVTVQ